MIVTIKKNTPKQEVERLMQQLTNRGLKMYYTEGNNYDVIGLLGDVTAVDITWLKSFVFVQSVTRLAEPYKLASRLFHPEDTVVDVGGIKIGGEENLPILESDEIYTLMVDSSGMGEFDTNSTINYPCQYIDSENIVFTNVNIPVAQSHFTISKRELTDEEKENPYQYIFVHPSPSIDGNIFVECRLWEITPIEVEIFNVVGQPIYSGRFDNSNYYDVKANLPVSGTYVIIVKIEEQVLTYKVVRR